MTDLSILLKNCIDTQYTSGAFIPCDEVIPHNRSLSYAIKNKRTHIGESPLKNLAYEVMGIDFFVHTFRNFPKKPHGPLRPFVDDHFKALTHAFNAVLGDNTELPKAWYAAALDKPLCGLSIEAQNIYDNIIYALPRFPFHQGWLDKKELKRSFESKIKRTDQIDVFKLRGFPKSPWDQDDIIASYLYGVLHPEVWAGLWAWQFTTSQLFAALYDTSADVSNTYPKDWLATYRQYADMMSRVCVKALFPIFLLPGMATLDLSKKPDAADISRGLIHSISSGAFGSVARDDDGKTLKHACPFNGTGARLLMLDMAPRLSAGARSLAAFCIKLRDDSESQPMLVDLREELLMHAVNTCNQSTIKRFMKSARGQQFAAALASMDAPTTTQALLSRLA